MRETFSVLAGFVWFVTTVVIMCSQWGTEWGPRWRGTSWLMSDILSSSTWSMVCLLPNLKDGWCCWFSWPPYTHNHIHACTHTIKILLATHIHNLIRVCNHASILAHTQLHKQLFRQKVNYTSFLSSSAEVIYSPGCLKRSVNPCQFTPSVLSVDVW